MDSGGQNVYVGQIARHLALDSYEVDVFTRRDSPCLPEAMPWVEGVRIIHVPAGPPTPIPKQCLLPCMAEFTEYVRARAGEYDLLHANFWMSGLVAAEGKRTRGVPFVITLHALGRVRRLHLGSQDEFPVERLAHLEPPGGLVAGHLPAVRCQHAGREVPARPSTRRRRTRRRGPGSPLDLLARRTTAVAA